ncbi:MAG: DUF378 domain-containing protein [Candidatus Doudnabacteria bacterium]|nr:DUF378 domain-containing protein [Candidatus Doudnabacteria bacterium]
MKALHLVTWVLLVVGGLNWGLKIFSVDIGTWGLGDTVNNIIYALVALSALYELATHGKRCRMCKPDNAGMGMNKPMGM